MMTYMLIFRLGAWVACFLAAASAAALLLLLVLSRPGSLFGRWSGQLELSKLTQDNLHKVLYLKPDFAGRGAFLASVCLIGLVLLLPFMVFGDTHSGRNLHAEIIRMIVWALS